MPQQDYRIIQEILPSELIKVGIHHFYLILLPNDQPKLKRIKRPRGKFNTLLASSTLVKDFRQRYLDEFADLDQTYTKYRLNHPVGTMIWPEKRLAKHIRQPMQLHMQLLGCRSRLSYRVDSFQGYTCFMKLFSCLAEPELEEILHNTADDLEAKLQVFSTQAALAHIDSLHPLLNFNAISPKCIEILQMVANGASSQEISQQLYLTERGINYHLDRARDLMGARNRIHLISLAHRHGILN